MNKVNLSDFLKNKQYLAILVDPDFLTKSGTDVDGYLNSILKLNPDVIFVGGSLMTGGDLEESIRLLRSKFNIPIYIFPGDNLQLSDNADGILYLSLISGRNPEYLIGQHVQSSFKVKSLNIDVVPTGYILVECGRPTTAQYISNTNPIPYHKPTIAASTALAGELLGLKLTYLDGGSGADQIISKEMVSSVSKTVSTPLIVGGGVNKKSQVEELWSAGANLVVLGTSIEKGSFIND